MSRRIAGIALFAAALTAPPAARACINEEQDAVRELILAVVVGGFAGAAALVTAGVLLVWRWRSGSPKAPGVP